MNSTDRFFHYEPLFTSSFSKNLIIPEAVMSSRGQKCYFFYYFQLLDMFTSSGL
jgi:hypothetical protein